jgi:hypothetical protein
MTPHSLYALLGCTGLVVGQLDRYDLEVREKGDRYVLRVYNLRTSQTAWSLNVSAYGTVQKLKGWSKDRRALAVPVIKENGPDGSIVFWRAGQETWSCPRERIRRLGHGYELDEFVWSPDKRRVLFRTGGSGDFTFDVGSLWCADVQRKKLHLIADAPVRKMTWSGSTVARYWVGHLDRAKGEFVTPRKYETWRTR